MTEANRASARGAELSLDADVIASLRLIRTRAIGPITYLQLVRRFGSAGAALDALPELARRGGGQPPNVPRVSEIDKEMAAVAAHGGHYLLLGAANYPALLAEAEGAPPALIVIGDEALLNRPTVAMVGARNASAAAVRFARQLANDLSQQGIIVVSGLARGIDTAAHIGSLAGGTVGVIAGGIDIFYPPENEALQREIGARGLLVSEQPPGTEPHARHFPSRNRVIAGLSQGTVVIEAAPKSGSLITARLAAEYGRDVMAVPGSPLDPRAQGCNQLIRDGATLVQSANDILEALGPLGGRHVAAPPPQFLAEPQSDDAGETERRAVVALLSPSPVPVDELIRQSGVAPAQVQTILLELELAGRLARHAGGRVSLG